MRTCTHTNLRAIPEGLWMLWNPWVDPNLRAPDMRQGGIRQKRWIKVHHRGKERQFFLLLLTKKGTNSWFQKASRNVSPLWRHLVTNGEDAEEWGQWSTMADALRGGQGRVTPRGPGFQPHQWRKDIPGWYLIAWRVLLLYEVADLMLTLFPKVK